VKDRPDKIETILSKFQKGVDREAMNNVKATTKALLRFGFDNGMYLGTRLTAERRRILALA
jgi:hypothetical protein